ncbi:MAG: acylglycerol kinase family protein, partial [Verrucomicrobiota bacterium]|nr:acylglycerol kinase family protein [Verrucomicrobiota bacterium]
MASKRILLIANPASGQHRGERRLNQASEYLASLGQAATTALTESPGHATRLAKANAPNFEIITALGGDGTVNEVANGLMAVESSKRPALATLPVGTGNDIALTFGLAHFESALDTLANGNTRALDVIRVHLIRNGKSIKRHALLFVAAGFAAEVIR